MAATTTRNALGTFFVLRARGYRLEALTRTKVTEHRDGALLTTYADRLRVAGGPKPIPADLVEAIREHKPLLIVAAAAAEPPVPWVAALMQHYHEGRILPKDRRGEPGELRGAGPRPRCRRAGAGYRGGPGPPRRPGRG